MLDNLPLHRNFITILVPLVLLAGRIRSNVTQGVRAERMNTPAIWR